MQVKQRTGKEEEEEEEEEHSEACAGLSLEGGVTLTELTHSNHDVKR